MKKHKRVFDVVGAFITDKHDRVLLCKRMDNDQFGAMWEFPGGKVEMHEDKKGALKRELREELGIEVIVGRLINRFQDEAPEMKIYAYIYACSISNGIPQCIECQDIRWVAIDEGMDLNLAPVDKKIIRYLRTKRQIFNLARTVNRRR